MPEKTYISRNYRSKFDAAGKAKIDCETILEANGWKNVGLPRTTFTNGILNLAVNFVSVSIALFRARSRSIMVLQYPFKKFYSYSLWVAQLRGCRVITIVHDVRCLKGKESFTQKELSVLAHSECLIVHNDAMKKWFESHQIKSKLVVLEVFDYLHTPMMDKATAATDIEKLRVVFAGNMGGKESFIYKLDEAPQGSYRVDLFGVGFESRNVQKPAASVLHYQGAFPSWEVIDRIDGDFGLVWYGESLDDCRGLIGEYLRYNSPHKFSLYIQCEMPIIIWNQAAMAAFVERFGIGFSVASLRDLQLKLENISVDEYNNMKAKTIAVKNRLERGGFLASALEGAERTLS